MKHNIRYFKVIDKDTKKYCIWAYRICDGMEKCIKAHENAVVDSIHYNWYDTITTGHFSILDNWPNREIIEITNKKELFIELL